LADFLFHWKSSLISSGKTLKTVNLWRFCWGVVAVRQLAFGRLREGRWLAES
jgi:hypothetical protein